MARFAAVSSLILLLVFVASAQTQPQSDPQAVSFASQSIAAMTGGNAIGDVTLTANVSWIPGPEPQAGTGVLLAKGTSESRIDIALSSSSKRTEIRNALSGPAGKWVNPDGTSGLYALHNCLTDAAWFFPALSSLTNIANSGFLFSYVGEETWNGLSTQHLRVSQDNPVGTQRLSAMDFYIDPTSFLVLGVAYKTHPDSNMNVDLLSEVHFADYQLVNGIEVPFHIQRLQNGTLMMDVNVTGASFNSGLSDAAFQIN
jgi:hypothetical protein